jgi:uncharacterized protein (TIGR02646 family)
MKNVKRSSEPLTLQKNKKKWTEELIKKIADCKRTGEKVPDRFYNKYKDKDILEALRKMYKKGDFCLCCYCESIIDDVSYEQIEHRMPKKKTLDKYPEKTFSWDNLHLACTKCNLHKSNKYAEDAPILDSVSDPIEDHLGYALDDAGGGVYRKPLTARGITTVEDADLDRPQLRFARVKIWNATLKSIQQVILSRDDSRTYTAKKILKDHCTGEHGSLIKYLMLEWGVWE